MAWHATDCISCMRRQGASGHAPQRVDGFQTGAVVGGGAAALPSPAQPLLLLLLLPLPPSAQLSSAAAGQQLHSHAALLGGGLQPGGVQAGGIVGGQQGSHVAAAKGGDRQGVSGLVGVGVGGRRPRVCGCSRHQLEWFVLESFRVRVHGRQQGGLAHTSEIKASYVANGALGGLAPSWKQASARTAHTQSNFQVKDSQAASAPTHLHAPTRPHAPTHPHAPNHPPTQPTNQPSPPHLCSGS